jgi:hypothetical protein
MNKINMEVWKSIKGYEGQYEVSNLGNVRSLDRYIDNKYNLSNGRFATKEQIEKGEYEIRKKFIKGRLLKPLRTGNGYVYVYIDGKNKTIHRLVAEMFLEKNDFNLVEHLNHNKKDNRVENLMWSNQKYNVMRSVKDGKWNNQWTK